MLYSIALITTRRRGSGEADAWDPYLKCVQCGLIVLILHSVPLPTLGYYAMERVIRAALGRWCGFDHLLLELRIKPVLKE